jgi:peptide/nickel transport system substrate-binding protein
VNYAVDRNKLAADLYGAGLAEPSCQSLPRNFPAFKPYCPYTRPGPAAYNGPDLVKARRLVAQSGTRRAPVAVYQEINLPNDRAVLADFVAALRAIGYQASAHPVPCRYVTTCLPYQPRADIQVSGAEAWFADYPAPDTFFDPTNSCRVRNGWPSGFCDPEIDQVAALARRTSLTDPTAARRLWTRVDRLVTDAAPWIMIGSAVAYQLTAPRVGNYQQGFNGPIYSQLWVR